MPKAEINARNVAGDTPLHSAAAAGACDVVELLLDSGASTAMVNSDGQTPLAVARHRGRADVVALLERAWGGTSAAATPEVYGV